MNIPGLPTDNLYKFICLSGLIVLLACPYYAYTSSNELMLRSNAHLTELELLNKNYEFLQNDVEALGKDVADDKQGSDADHLPGLQGRRKVLQERMRELKLSKIKINSMEAEVNLLERRQSLIYTLFLRGLVCGMSLFLIGAYLWYTKVQRLQDAILQSQAKQNEEPSNQAL